MSSKRTMNRRWTIVAGVTLGLLGLVPVTAALTGDSASADPVAPGDGTTAATAGASCWGIKTQVPASTDGVYWLSNASMDRPAQFYCDMTTDGGGWVLVGRGRDGWTFNPNGQGSPATIRSTVDGPAAFAPASLDTTTIDALLAHRDLSAEPDGIRVERALTATGSTRQDYRLYTKGRTWTWNLAAGQLMNRIVIDGRSYNGSNTKDSAASVQGQTVNGLSGATDQRRLVTAPATDKGNRQGFGLGTVSGGSSAASNFLWTKGTEGRPLPFTRVWLRPQIANDAAGFTPIPANGYPAQAKPTQLKSRSELARWGVVGSSHVNETSVSPWYTNVMITKVYGDRVYVGGRFTQVQQGPGGTQYDQPFLAAFDLEGNWISDFRPKLDGRVWDMTMTDNGRFVIGGDFTTVNGTTKMGLAAINPATGALDPSWNPSVTRNGGRPIVRALDSRGPYVYVGGRFNQASGGTATNVGVPNTVNFSTTTGQPGGWRPIIHASPARIRVSTDGTKVYLGGWFNAVNDDTNMGFYAITDIATGKPSAGYGPYQPSAGSRANNWYQQAVADNGDGKLLVGGAEHTLQMYNSDRTEQLNSHITKSGGDFQAIEVIDGEVYASCHCLNWNYSGTNSWSNPSNFRAVDPIRFIGRYDGETLDYDSTWYPNGLKGIYDEGVWGIASDKNKCLWIGGDLQRGAYSGNAATDWLGGFARFCPADTTPPSAPTALKATTGPSSVDLSWGAATDDSGSVSYDVYRNDRVVATVYGTSYSDPVDTGATGATGALRYTVRASDARGNRSASPAPVAVNGPAPVLATPVTWGDTWSYADQGTTPAPDWAAPTYDAAAWPTGKAPLGWGTNQQTTVGPTKPTTTYYRHDFTLDDPSQVKLLTLQLKVSQGAVVYVNGVEAGRSNMPDGTITAATTAASYIGGSENQRIKSFAVPGRLLQAGRNTIAVEVHGWRAGSGVTLFDLSASAQGSTGDHAPPSTPSVTVEPAGGQVQVQWTPSTDDVALGGYLIERDGAPITVVGASTTSLIDPIAPTEAHTYKVTAFDTAGNTSTSDPVTLTPGAVDQELLDFHSTWRWSYPTAGPDAAWNAPGYDDTTWAAGPGELGFGDTPKGTVISGDPAPRPLTSYYRTTVDVSDPSQFNAIALDLIRNGGAVVYVNGVEVARSNLPAGTVTPGTYASTAVATADRHTPVRIEVPASAFHDGTNTIAVELHLNWKSQPTAGFDLKVTGLTGP